MEPLVTVSHPPGPIPSWAVSPEELIGFRELCDLLDVGKGQIARYMKEPGFPDPVGKLASGRVWRRKDVEKWRKAHPKRPPGRPPKPAA